MEELLGSITVRDADTIILTQELREFTRAAKEKETQLAKDRQVGAWALFIVVVGAVVVLTPTLTLWCVYGIPLHCVLCDGVPHLVLFLHSTPLLVAPHFLSPHHFVAVTIYGISILTLTLPLTLTSPSFIIHHTRRRTIDVLTAKQRCVPVVSCNPNSVASKTAERHTQRTLPTVIAK